MYPDLLQHIVPAYSTANLKYVFALYTFIVDLALCHATFELSVRGPAFAPILGVASSVHQ